MPMLTALIDVWKVLAMPIISLPMYDWPEVREATDAWAHGIARHLREHGFPEAPSEPLRCENHGEAWLSPDLLLSQTCGYPLTHTYARCLRPVAHAALFRRGLCWSLLFELHHGSSLGQCSPIDRSALSCLGHKRSPLHVRDAGLETDVCTACPGGGFFRSHRRDGQPSELAAGGAATQGRCLRHRCCLPGHGETISTGAS